MDKQQLYDVITARKIKPKDFEPYDGNNGRVNRCVDLFSRCVLNRGGVLVDVGGGIGDLGHAVRSLFDETIVVDISQKNLDAARAKGNSVLLSDVDRSGLDIASDSIEVVTALDFIEHIVDPENFARECFRVLRSGGQTFINTPNIQFWRHLKSLVADGVFPHTSGDREVFHGGHLAFYTFKDMNKIFGEVGFVNPLQIKDDEGYNQPPEFWIEQLKPTNQEQYVRACMMLGNPNLLFRCEKP